MQGDFTRNTFDPAYGFSRVLMQQGRVTLDADFNEQTSILIDYMRHLAVDMFGPYAGPKNGAGFEIVTAAAWNADVETVLKRFYDTNKIGALQRALQGGDVLILPGRYYVYGLQVANVRPILYSEQKGYPYFDPAITVEQLPKAGRPYLFCLEVWEQPITALEVDALREVALGGPDTCMRARVHWQVRAVICPQGIDIDNFTCAYADTLPGIGTGKLRARARLDKPPVDLCAIPPESSYRGPENQLYRVEIHAGGRGASARGTSRQPVAIPVNRAVDQSATIGFVHTGTIASQAEVAAATTASAAAAGAAAAPPPPPPPAGIATFVWSRENGSVVLPLLSLADPTAVVSFLGRDRRLSIEAGDLVEVMDDSLADAGVAGPLAQVKIVDPDTMTVTLQFAAQGTPKRAYTPGDVDTLHPRLIRWDKAGDMNADGAIQVVEGPDENSPDNGWIELEDGVQIRFEPGRNYQVGDYWLIPARVITGDVEWPHIADGDGNPIALPRDARGERHFYAPLTLCNPAGGQGGVAQWSDCRCLVANLCTNKK